MSMPFLYSPQYKDIVMHFKPVFGVQKLVLDDKRYVTTLGDTVAISTFRMYISQIKYTFEDNSSYTEPNSYHLLDAEEEGSFYLNIKNVPNHNIRLLTFNIGVDSLANVSGALAGDLDPIKGMYWAWNTGYINAKLEGKSRSCSTKNNIFEFHIGGYLPPYNTLRSVSLPIPKNALEGPIEVLTDVSKWFFDVKLSENNSVLMPNKMAMNVADNCAKMFRIIANDEK